MKDHAEWVHACAEEMASANDVGDTRKLYQLVKQLSGKEDKQPAVDLSVDKQGAVITNATERADAWYEFLKSKFAATAAEQGRPEMPALPVRDANNKLKVEEVWKAVTGLKNHKAVGADGIPVEVYKLSTPAFTLLYTSQRKNSLAPIFFVAPIYIIASIDFFGASHFQIGATGGSKIVATGGEKSVLDS